MTPQTPSNKYPDLPDDLRASAEERDKLTLKLASILADSARLAGLDDNAILHLLAAECERGYLRLNGPLWLIRHAIAVAKTHGLHRLTSLDRAKILMEQLAQNAPKISPLPGADSGLRPDR